MRILSHTSKNYTLVTFAPFTSIIINCSNLGGGVVVSNRSLVKRLLNHECKTNNYYTYFYSTKQITPGTGTSATTTLSATGTNYTVTGTTVSLAATATSTAGTFMCSWTAQ